jgi:hypothetical protein
MNEIILTTQNVNKICSELIIYDYFHVIYKHFHMFIQLVFSSPSATHNWRKIHTLQTLHVYTRIVT